MDARRANLIPNATGPLLLACCIACMPSIVVAAQPSAPPLMLARVYQADADLSDYWVSEKYDGVRAYWDGQALLTRAGHPIHAPEWFIAGWPRIPLDGELWIGRGEFETLVATVRDQKPDDAAWRRVRYRVFDLPAHAGPFTERLAILDALLATLVAPTLQPVPQTKVTSRTALDRKFRAVLAAGGEGLMLHRGGSLYRAERSDDLLKLKPHLDAEARVVGYAPGKGKYRGMLGALALRRADGRQFRLAAGLTDEQRRHPPPIGSWVVYSYQGVTAKGAPRFARFIRVADDAPPY
jgi:DNA ligase 1